MTAAPASRRFLGALGVVAVFAFAFRVYVILVVRPSGQLRCSPPAQVLIPCGDAWHYYWAGRELAAGDGYVDPAFVQGYRLPQGDRASAYHPPMYSTYLAAADLVGLKSLTGNRLASALLGAGTVVAIGLLARRMGGDRAGLVAAGIAALYPQLWANDEMLLSESLYALSVALALLFAYRFSDRPSRGNAAWLGGAIAVAALTRSEAALLFVILVVPLAFLRRDQPWKQRVQLAGVAWLIGVLLMGPWVAFNLARFKDPVLITTGIGSTMLQGNCDSTYGGPLLGFHDLNCVNGVSREGDESQVESRFFSVGVDYVRAHKGRVPLVVAARVGRVWDGFRPIQNANLNVLPEGRTRFEAFAGLWSYYALLFPGALGFVVLRRRKIPVWPLLTTVVIVTITAATAYAITRYRVPSEVALVALAGVGVDQSIGWVRRGSARRAATRVRELSDAQFARVLLAVAGAGLVVRVLFAVSRRHSPLLGDDYWYYWQARALAHGHVFIDPLVWRTVGASVPSAGHAPLYTAYLAILPLIGVTSPFAMRLASCLLGAAAVYVIGRAGVRIAGPRAGLAAATVAAVAPSLWINDGMLLSESMYALTIAFVLWSAYGFWQAPTTRNAAYFGGALALAAYSRPEAVFLAVLLGGTWLLTAGGRSWRERVRQLGVVAGVMVVVLSPWLVRNVVVFDKPVFMSDSPGPVLAAANCDTTYHGQFIGLFDLRCVLDDLDATPSQRAAVAAGGGPGLGRFLYEQAGDESAVQARLQHAGLRYVEHHLTRAPVVAVVRVARTWDLIFPRQQVQFNQFIERRGLWPSRAALVVHWVVLALAVGGLVLLRRRRVALGPLLAVIAMATITSALSIGLTRYRIAADVALVIVAGVALDALAEHLPRDQGREPAE